MKTQNDTLKAIKQYQGRPLTDKELAWGTDWRVLPILEYRGKRYCPRCGKLLEPNDTKRKTCPHCGGKIEPMSEWRKWKSRFDDTIIASYADVCEIDGTQYQVLRTVMFKMQCRKGEGMREWHNDVVNVLIPTNGGDIYAKHNNQVPLRKDYVFWGEMENVAKYHSSGYGWSTLDHYTSTLIYPQSKLIKPLRDMGYTPTMISKSGEWNNIDVIRAILGRKKLTTKQESVMKTNPRFFTEFISTQFWEEHWHIVKILHRNHYAVNNFKDYKDYIKQLEELGYDTHNAFYLCPKNFAQAHSRLTKLIDRKRKEERLKEQMEEMMKKQKQIEEYNTRMMLYAGLVWDTGNVKIMPLMSVDDVKEEGEKQHHCVFQCGYWEDSHNLLLTSSVNGKKAETIQIDLRAMKIVQSRGVNNTHTAYHDEIVNYINAHINEFKPRKRAKTRKAA